jgi:FtsP/CotA-like multicopper oxidase with cupredoxin domain
MQICVDGKRLRDRQFESPVTLACSLGFFASDKRGDKMFISKSASRIRQKEAQNARDNRAEIVQALSLGDITRRDLIKWGIFTSAGTLACKNGLSPFAPSAFAGSIPTGAPRSMINGALKFSQPMNRLHQMKPHQLRPTPEGHAAFPDVLNERPAKRLSYHTDYTNEVAQGNVSNEFRNPLTGRGPIEGRPPGEIFAHQRWEQYFPKVGYLMSLANMSKDCKFHPAMAEQRPNKVWCYGAGNNTQGEMPPFLIKARYGEPMLMRVYNNLPKDRKDNSGFGRNESQFHFHNAHNGAESDGAANTHHFPGTFYDYRWSTTLARADKINTDATDARASGPDGNGGLVKVPGDYRELQGTMWAHDHRFFYTAENVYKGNFGAITYYSGPDRGHEALEDGVNLRLPSGTRLDWGNVDFDVNLMFHDACLDRDGQLFFDIFDTKGMLGDLMMVNGTYAPYLNVLPRKYRFRIQNACISRIFKLVLANAQGAALPVYLVSMDGNLIVSPLKLTALDIQAMAERFDIVIDFSQLRVGDKAWFVNTVKHLDGQGLDSVLSLSNALVGSVEDPVVGRVMEFRVVSQVESVDEPGYIHRSTDPDRSLLPSRLTDPILVVAPVRKRLVQFGKPDNAVFTSRGPDGQCVPDCPEYATFPWVVQIDGKPAHSFNANRVSLLVPKPGEVEHWTYENIGGGWDHPIHLHFEEGITISRSRQNLLQGEKGSRKDVWRLGPRASVTFQVQFGEYGGAYVNHCHNTVHEDYAMLARIQLLGLAGTPQAMITPTPNPTPDGVSFTTPEVLPEGLPAGFSLKA